jgi:hypothetical protein
VELEFTHKTRTSAPLMDELARLLLNVCTVHTEKGRGRGGEMML